MQIVSGSDDVKDAMSALTTGTSVEFTGRIVRQPIKKRRRGEEEEGKSGGENARPPPFELHADACRVIGSCDGASYPLQKKKHSLAFLREQLHLRPRSRTIGAVTRVRSEASHALQSYLHDANFFQVHTPVLTSNDCEGAGELFTVTSEHSDGDDDRRRDESDEADFFGQRRSYLTVSGQLQAEMFACSMGRVYSFGPTFRAEDSNTSRHLAEFWMLEPEMAFATLDDILELSQGLLRHTIGHLLDRCDDDLAFFEERMMRDDELQHDMPLRRQLDCVASEPFVRMTYTEAVSALTEKHRVDPGCFEYPAVWGKSLQTEHERWLAEEHCAGRPVFVTDYPAECKAFYMRRNGDEDASALGPTVGAVDLLVPRIGELIGGSEREERMSLLESRMSDMGLLPHLQWYLDLRRFGTVRHGGFGLGFERLLMFVTGMTNIRDVISVPRYPGFNKF